MNGAGDEFARLVIDAVRTLTSRQLNDTITRLESCGGWEAAESVFAYVGSYDPASARVVRDLAKQAKVGPHEVAGWLRGAMAMAESGTPESTVEIVWTGPSPTLTSLRRTEQALFEVIEAAQRELWIVSFATYGLPSVCAALVAAAGRGCRVRLLLESEVESDGRLAHGSVEAVPDEVRSCCELYVWPRERRDTDERGRFGLLHAKCAVADGEILFVGSANLTDAAFDRNIELGVLTRGGRPAAIVERQLRWLVDSATMALVRDDSAGPPS